MYMDKEIKYQLIERNEGILLDDDLLSPAEVKDEYERIKSEYLQNHTEEQFYNNFDIKVLEIRINMYDVYGI